MGEDDTVPYSTYEDTMKQLDKDFAQLRSIKQAADTYLMAHPETRIGTFYCEVPEHTVRQLKYDLVDEIQQLGTENGTFSYDSVARKLGGTPAIFSQTLDVTQDELTDDLTRSPLEKYLDEHESSILSQAPGEFEGERRFAPFFQQENLRYHMLVKEVAERIDNDDDPYTYIDEWAKRVDNDWRREQAEDPDPDKPEFPEHDRMYY